MQHDSPSILRTSVHHCSFNGPPSELHSKSTTMFCAVLLKMISAPHCDEQEEPAAAINATREHTVGGLAKYLLFICKSCGGRGKQFMMREKLVRGVFK